MNNVKTLKKEDIEKVIAYLEAKLARIKEIASEGDYYSSAKALGYAEGTIESVIKQLKGDYPIV